MAATTDPAAPQEQEEKPGRSSRTAFVAAGLAAFAVLVIGGYSGHWPWTGFSDNDTLWDWLSLLLLPLIIATIPVWLQSGRYMDARVKRLIIGVVTAFAVLVLLGYLVPLKWTGFQGNTLWDWFGLLMLPFVISTIRLWSDLRPRLDTRHFVIAGIELAI